MALSDKELTDNICNRLTKKGFRVDGEFSRQRGFIEAIAEGIIEELKSKGEVDGEKGRIE